MKLFVNPEPKMLRCNMCGKLIEKNRFGYSEDALVVSKIWGYESPSDGETHTFCLCYDCYEDLAARFVIPPHIADRFAAVAE